MIFAKEIPDPDERITDKVGVFTTSQERTLESSLQNLHDDTGVEIALLAIDSTDGQDHAQYAVEVAQKRGIGKSDKDNGILILIALDDRQIEISTGYGVEGLLPDVLAYRIASQIRVPYAKEKQYYEGAVEVIAQLSGLVHQDPEMMSYRNDKQSQQTSNSGDGSLLRFLIILGLHIGLVVGGLLRPHLKSSSTKYLALGAIPGGWTLVALALVGAVGIHVLIPTLITSFFGLFSERSSSHHHNSGGFFPSGGSSRGGMGSSGGSFGGGFGGFGGGSFGGGGAGASR